MDNGVIVRSSAGRAVVLLAWLNFSLEVSACSETEPKTQPDTDADVVV